MTNNTINQYGTTVVEFFKFEQSEYQEILSKRVTQYNTRSEGLHYRGAAANVDFVKHAPLEIALIELQDTLKKGYSIIKASYDPLYFKALLKKPESMIAAELPKIAELATEEYDQDRYQRNVTETARQIEITVARKAREAAAAAEKVIAKRQASEADKALADLLRAYAKPAQVDAEVTP